MWADNETTQDLLNYEVHCDLIKEYLTAKELLPLTIGVFGDWGSGKSSIMRMLEEKLKADEKVLTIYFNSWLFESYEDAKISILENIILELSKNETLSNEAKKKVLELLSRVDYMKLTSDGLKKYGKNVIDIIATGGIGTAIEAGFSMLNQDTLTDLKKADTEELNKYIKKEKENPSKTTIKSFKNNFAKLIELTNFDSVVIFVDDLDRCMPERVIETLEAIKLFLSVDNTAFVIGADERILKHSISMHLKLHTFKNDSSYLYDSEQIVTDYIEKLIQIPYHIPKLSPSEIESYKNLLFCQNKLSPNEFDLIYKNYRTFREKEFYMAYSLGDIKEIINLNDYIELERLLEISHIMSLMITNILKGNPRQTKRFLNTFILRQKLGKVAKLEIDSFILIKLMLLEYFNTPLFKKLNDFQSKNDGFIKEVRLLESVYIDTENIEIPDTLKEWEEEKNKNWIKLEPKIGEIDLRDYFWLARDKTGSTLSDMHTVSRHIQNIYRGLVSDKEPERRVKLNEVKQITDEDISELIRLFEKNIHSIQDIKIHLKSLHKMIIQVNQYTFYEQYISIIKNTSYSKVSKFPFIKEDLEQILIKENRLSNNINELLLKYSNESISPLQIASKKFIEENNN